MEKTTREIADDLSVEKHRVKYAIKKLNLDKSGESGGAFLYDSKAQSDIKDFIQSIDGEHSENDSEDNTGDNTQIQEDRISDLKDEISNLREIIAQMNDNMKIAQENLERQQTLNFNQQQQLIEYKEEQARDDVEPRKWWKFWHREDDK